MFYCILMDLMTFSSESSKSNWKKFNAINEFELLKIIYLSISPLLDHLKSNSWEDWIFKGNEKNEDILIF